MIVNSIQSGWEIIYQRSHANLAAMLLSARENASDIPRWTELIVATAQHDDQEMFWSESKHLTDAGAPLDFRNGEIDTRRIQAKYVIDNAYRQGLWIALLISMHNSFLYEPLRGKYEKLDTFLDEQKKNQSAWRKHLGYTKKATEGAYAYLRWSDRLSLILCCRQIPDRDRELDIAPDENGDMIRIFQREDSTLGLAPWVLESDELTVSIEVRQLEQLKFKDEDEFQTALNDAEIQEREWCFVK